MKTDWVWAIGGILLLTVVMGWALEGVLTRDISTTNRAIRAGLMAAVYTWGIRGLVRVSVTRK